jgi:hypothetical protein
MNSSRILSPEKRRRFRRIVMGLVLAAAIGGIAAPAARADDNHDRRDQGHHEANRRDDHRDDHRYDRGRDDHGYYNRGYYAAAPVYAPPPVVYAPPPPPAALSFVFPLNFR